MFILDNFVQKASMADTPRSSKAAKPSKPTSSKAAKASKPASTKPAKPSKPAAAKAAKPSKPASTKKPVATKPSTRASKKPTAAAKSMRGGDADYNAQMREREEQDKEDGTYYRMERASEERRKREVYHDAQAKLDHMVGVGLMSKRCLEPAERPRCIESIVAQYEDDRNTRIATEREVQERRRKAKELDSGTTHMREAQAILKQHTDIQKNRLGKDDCKTQRVNYAVGIALAKLNVFLSEGQKPESLLPELCKMKLLFATDLLYAQDCGSRIDKCVEAVVLLDKCILKYCQVLRVPNPTQEICLTGSPYGSSNEELNVLRRYGPLLK